jgi:hypothetical protein
MNAIELYRQHLSEGERTQIEWVLNEADETPAKEKGLALHVEAIGKLRAKGYPYRDIAAWFNDRGFKVNHVDVWRAHRSALEIRECIDKADHDPEWSEFIKTKQDGDTTRYEEIDSQVEAALTAESPSGLPPVHASPVEIASAPSPTGTKKASRGKSKVKK